MGTVEIRGLDLIDGGHPYVFYSAAGSTGEWQLRAVPDGTYRVMWNPYLDPEEWPLAVPPVQSINVNPLDTVHDNIVHVITRTVEIRGANRILDIDFGIPPRSPVVGARELPGTGGRGAGGSRAGDALLYGALAVSLSLGLGGAVLARRRGRHD